MTTAARSSRSRLLALLLFFGVPAVLLTLSIVNMFQLGDNALVASEKEFQLSALMRRLTMPAKDGKPLDLSHVYVAGESATLASANLQTYLVKSIADVSGKLIETVASEPEDNSDPTVGDNIGIKASFSVDNPGLLELLHRLESGLPLVFINHLSVRRLTSDDSVIGKEALRVDMEATGRWKVAGP
ncbi:hypothetical protein IHQ71_31610 (plasmid) [Rhizobium sp. TH2]|uniref:type II secretion system protein GspM n=1 Tax=Rhizobium sp. TH2 TaxID=2775403 RepID=UPI0021576107|nr:type II secretion system protein GspM [Rhizobium sp. TH2]UVC12617.1 hypothetical protein IHQ71_31610 [Rhizobium sp. TH2]